MNLADFRQQKDEAFRREGSPIKLEDLGNFSGLKYFPENSALRLELPLDENISHDDTVLQTSTGSQRTYVRAGKIHFLVDNEPVTLTVFSDSNGYFLPFRDGTNAGETYGAGRYLEPEEMPNGNLLVDFNLAYNPYCAYNEAYSCPLPPPENRTPVRIEAGEQRWH